MPQAASPLPVMPLPPAEPLVEAMALTLRRAGRTVLDGVDLAVGPGEIVTLIGPNGAGKSTLVRVLLGLVAPDSGRVRRRVGLRVGYSPQAFSPDPVLPLTVARFLTLGARAHRPELLAVLTRVGMEAALTQPMIGLSGGELRRVVLARALLRAPELLILDEPMSGVDVAGQMELYGLVARIRDETGAGVLLVSHDLHLVMARTDRVVCLDGHVCCAGRPLEVAGDPVFQRLFGQRLSDVMALYPHHHDHRCERHHAHHHLALEAEEG
jgi:zinc transport system ATP-binding protein